MIAVMASLPDRRHLIALLDEMFLGPAWHGPALRDALRGVKADEATRRPAPGRHNVAEIAVHAAYWKYVVRRRIVGDDKLQFPLIGRNYFDRTRLTAAAWRQDLALLDEEHRLLRAAVASLPRTRFAARFRTSPPWTVRQTIQGVAAHDAYHAGQIRLVRRLVR